MASSAGSSEDAQLDDDVQWPNGYWHSLFDFARVESGEPPLAFFGTLQATNITHLLNEIAIIKGEAERRQTVSPAQMQRLRVLLHQYADAIRDYKFLAELERPSGLAASEKWMSLMGAFDKIDKPYDDDDVNRPYHTDYRTLERKVVPNRDAVREFLRLHLPRQLTWTEREMRRRGDEYSAGRPPDGYSPAVDSLARFAVGTAGGAALIVPMVVMVFRPSLTKSLVTVSVAVLLFALGVGIVFETNNRDTVTATATYAAVLVVFVGTSGSS